MAEDEQEHKTMIKQLTDLDDHALDEQAGLFMHPRRKSLRSGEQALNTPRPLSQPFFQPLQVFPDVLNVSAMVERQGQKDLTSAVTTTTTTTTTGEPSTGSQNDPHERAQSMYQNDASVRAIVSSNGFQQQQQRMDDSSVPSTTANTPHTAVTAPVQATATASAAVNNDVSPPSAQAASQAIGQTGLSITSSATTASNTKPTLRSISMTKFPSERSSGGGEHKTVAAQKVKKQQQPLSGGGSGLHIDPPLPPATKQALRSNTPISTPTEENDRQLSVETSKAPNKRPPKRTTANIGNSSNSTPTTHFHHPNQASGGGGSVNNSNVVGRRFMARNTKSNPASRTSEEEHYHHNSDDDDEQFIYRNSRSSLHVGSSIPEEPYDDATLPPSTIAGTMPAGTAMSAATAAPTHNLPPFAYNQHLQQGHKRANRHNRLSTYMSGNSSVSGAGGQQHLMSPYSGIDRRDSSGGGGGGGGYIAPNGPQPGSYPAVGRIGGRSRGGGRLGRGHGNSSINATVSGGSSGHRFSILGPSNNDYGGGSGLTSEESDIDDEPAGLRSTYNNTSQYSRRNSRRAQSNLYYGSSEEMPETTPLFRRRQQAHHRKRQSAAKQALYAVLYGALIAALLFMLAGLFNYTSAPLEDVEAIKISNILATEKQLLFILHLQATNPNVREVLIERSEIGVFAAKATPSNGTDDNGAPTIAATANGTEPAILLGNVYELGDPVRFAPGSFSEPAKGLQTTQISIHHPGASVGGSGGDGMPGDDDGGGGGSGSDAEKWKQLLKGPYDLTVRGTLRYTLWQRNYAARICIAKLANLPPGSNDTFVAMDSGMGCDGDGDTIKLPPAPPSFASLFVKTVRQILWKH